jgi:hypothetical protein
VNPLAQPLVDVLYQLREANARAEAHRLVAQVATNALRELTLERDRLRDAHHRLVDEYRNLRRAA